MSEAELRVMDVLWNKGPATVQQVLDSLSGEHDLAYNSVLTTIRILENDASLPPAEGLRRAMLSVLNDTAKPRNAHPGAWAPFVIVGTTGRSGK